MLTVNVRPIFALLAQYVEATSCLAGKDDAYFDVLACTEQVQDSVRPSTQESCLATTACGPLHYGHCCHMRLNGAFLHNAAVLGLFLVGIAALAFRGVLAV